MPSPQAWVTASRSTATPDSSVGDGVLGRSGPRGGWRRDLCPRVGRSRVGRSRVGRSRIGVPGSDPASVADAVSWRRLIAPTEGRRPTPSGRADVSTGVHRRAGFGRRRGRALPLAARCERPLQGGYSLGQGLDPGIEVGAGAAHEGNLQHDLGVGSIPHVDEGLPEHLHGPHQAGHPHRFGQGREGSPPGARDGAQLGGECGQEGLAQIVHQFGGQLWRSPASGQELAQRHQHRDGIAVGHGGQHRAQLGPGRIGRFPTPPPGPGPTARHGPSLDRGAPRPAPTPRPGPVRPAR